jgi:hypothetical protein
MNDLNGYECEIRYYIWLEDTNLALKKKTYISILCSDILQKLPPPFLAGMSKCQASQLHFLVHFHAFCAPLAVQNA